MNIKKSDIVLSLSGRDRGGQFLVVDTEDIYAMLADGKGRRLEKPKRKKVTHIQFLAESDSRAAEKLRIGDKVSNSEIRRALAEFSAGMDGDKGGM